MFKLTRVSKKGRRQTAAAAATSSGPTTTTKTAAEEDDPVVAVKKRRRGPPIPSTFVLDAELERAERAFLEEDEDDNKSTATQKTNKDPMGDVAPNKQKKSKLTTVTKEQAQVPSSTSCCNDENDNDSDDSILEVEVLTRKKDAASSNGSSCTQSKEKTVPKEVRAVKHEREIPKLPPIEDKMTSVTATTQQQQSSAAIIASLSEALKQRIDVFMATGDPSLKEIYAKFDAREIDRHALKVYVYKKIGHDTPRKSKKKKRQESKISQETNTSTMTSESWNAPLKKSGGDSSTPLGVGQSTSSDDRQSATVLSQITEQPKDTKASSGKLDTVKDQTSPLPPPPPVASVDMQEKPIVTEAPETEPAKKNTRGPRKRVTKKETEGVAAENRAKTTPKPRAAPKRKREPAKKCCQLCSQCPCRMRKESDDVATLNVSQSDQAVEKSLIKRLQKVQKVSERYAGQEEAVRRQLKNHRRDMWRKRERLHEMARQHRAEESTASRFLPDVDEIERHFHLASNGSDNKASNKEKDNARGRVFGPRKSYQPTLTQLMGGPSECNGEQEGNENEESQGNVPMDKEARETRDESSVAPEPNLVDNNVDDMESDDLPEDEPVPVERIQWVDGEARTSDGEPVVAQSSTLWSCSTTGRPFSTWDRLFDDPASTENMDMDDLLELFEGPVTAAEEADTGPELCSQGVDMSMLSQRGYDRAQNIVQQINNNPRRLEEIKSICPNWEENVCFAMQQRDEEEIAKALAAVQHDKERLARGMAALERLFERHTSALSVFEESLTTSLKRLDTSHQIGVVGARSSLDYRTSQSHRNPPLDADADNSQMLTQNKEEMEEAKDEEVIMEQNSRTTNAQHSTGTGLGDAQRSIPTDVDCKTDENGRDTRIVDWPIDQHSDTFCATGRTSVDTDAATLIATASPRQSGMWTGRRSVDTDTATLIATASPRRTSIAACHSPLLPPTALRPSQQLSVASP